MRKIAREMGLGVSVVQRVAAEDAPLAPPRGFDQSSLLG